MKLTQGTFEELKKGGSDTHDLAEAAKRQAETSRAIAEAARVQVESSKAIAERALTQAKATADIASEARRSANTAERALGLQARPWIGLDGRVRIDGIVNAQTLKVTFTYTVKNFGPIPALSVLSHATIRSFSDTNPDELDKAIKHQSDMQCLFAEMQYAPPGPEFSSRQLPPPPQRVGPGVFIGETVFPDQRLQMPMSETGPGDPGRGFWGVGCVAYFGPTGPVHHTRFCFESEGPANQVKPGQLMFSCGTNNIVD